MNIISENLLCLRKSKNLTQANIADELGVSFQAVSKWECGSSLPDIELLPMLADIFCVTVDALLGREKEQIKNDDKIRIIAYRGNEIIESVDELSNITVNLEGEPRDVECHCRLDCKNILGNATAGAGLNCGNVSGSVSAGLGVNCGNVDGDVGAGLTVNCGNVEGNVGASGDIHCGDIHGNAECQGNIIHN
jgi:Predicted transcriptional regulators